MGAPAVVTVWIDNPPLNVVTRPLAAHLAEQLSSLDRGTRVVVLRGRGERAFSAGADLTSFVPDGKPPAGVQPLASLIESLPVPVVAAVHGYCLGGGLEIALACDVRVADRGASSGCPRSASASSPGAAAPSGRRG